MLDETFDWQRYSEPAVGLGMWVLGSVAGWWLAWFVARSLGRGDAQSRAARWAFRLTFLLIQVVLIVVSLEVAGVPISLSQVLNTPIVMRDGDPLLMQNVLFAAVWVLGGLVLGGYLARGVKASLLQRRVNPTSAEAVGKGLFYLLLLTVVLAALQELRVPMSSLAFLGGAVAIGVGFGAQNLINNFISGWILMTERPVRIGDLVEVDEVHGRVESIGARCTRIRRTDGIDLLVPNSKLLENSVVNWTLMDEEIRTRVRIGVIYGSPTDRVVEIIRSVLDENPNVLRKPEPDIIFEDFGDNSLVFDVYFWTNASAPMQLNRVCSEVRFRVDALFREAGIVIAFPQRDVHLDARGPIPVRVVEESR